MMMDCLPPQCPDGEHYEVDDPDVCCSFHCVPDQGTLTIPYLHKNVFPVFVTFLKKTLCKVYRSQNKIHGKKTGT